MGIAVLPTTYLIGYQAIDLDELDRYLRDTSNDTFLQEVFAARKQGLSDGEILCSFYAKLCYASLSEGKNLNLSDIRGVPANLRGCFDMGHGSVFEHANLNFVVTNCSRVFTHELVRHRVGTAFSQTSGRYVRSDRLDVVNDPLLDQSGVLSASEAAAIGAYLEGWMQRMGKRIEALDADRDLKKRLTSAARRWLPNGQANEIGFSCNIRTLRHLVQIRTSRHAEWEIRYVFEQVYRLTRKRFPLLYYGAREEEVRGIVEVSGMRMQPYDRPSSIDGLNPKPGE